MSTDLTEERIAEVLGVADFVQSCDEAFRLYGTGRMTNLPRSETLEQDGGQEVFRLELSGDWPGVASSRKVIVERSDVAKGRLGDRTATIKLTMSNGQRVLLGAELITNRRTGAAAVLGVKYLAPQGTARMAVLGTGRVAQSVVLAADAALDLEEVVVTSRTESGRERFLESVTPLVRTPLTAVNSVEAAVTDVEVVVTTVPTPDPILFESMLDPGTHLSVIAGDPRTVQLDRSILVSRPIVVDDHSQAMASGDFIRYADHVNEVGFPTLDGAVATIGDAANGRLDAYRGKGCVAYFTGMAIQDLHAAFMAAEAAGLGT